MVGFIHDEELCRSEIIRHSPIAYSTNTNVERINHWHQYTELKLTVASTKTAHFNSIGSEALIGLLHGKHTVAEEDRPHVQKFGQCNCDLCLACTCTSFKQSPAIVEEKLLCCQTLVGTEGNAGENVRGELKIEGGGLGELVCVLDTVADA